MTTGRIARQRTLGVAVIVASILLIVGLIAWIGLARSAGGGDFQGEGTGEEQVVEIAEGSSVSALGPQLEEKGVVKSNSAFQSAAMAHPESHNIQPGFYLSLIHISEPTRRS